MSRPRFNRPLTDQERILLLRLGVGSVAAQLGCTAQNAADALDEFTERGDARFVVDETDAHLVVAGRSLVHAERDWLSFHASQPDWDD